MKQNFSMSLMHSWEALEGCFMPRDFCPDLIEVRAPDGLSVVGDG